MTQNKFTTNNNTTLVAVSNADGETPVYLYADPATHGLILSATLTGGPIPASGATSAVNVQIVDGGGNQITSFGGGTQYTDGGTPPAHPIGPILQFNNGGTWNTVSAANPLPVSATISTAGLATSTKQSDGSQKTQIVDGSGNVIAATSNALNAFLTNSSLAVTGTFFQATQPISGTITANAGTGNFTVINGGTFAVQATIASGATSIAKAEDVASADGDVGVPALAVRKATPANTSGTDGDYEFLQMSAGRLWVDASGKTLTVDGSGVTQPISGTVAGTGNFTVVQATASNLNATVVGTGTFVVQATLAAETTKVIGVVRNADGSGNLLTSTVNALDVNIKSGSIANTSFGATQATAANLNATVVGTGTFATQVTSLPALAAGTNVIGHVIVDSGAITVTATNLSTNVAQINGVTPLMGNGVTGTGSQRVTIASDNTAFSVNATLSAETTKVIGTVNQGTSPWVTSNATTSVVGNGAAATAQRVTLANDSTGIIATVGAVTAITNALPVGANVIGKVSIDQTTPGTTNLVALAANQSTNVAQLAGTTTDTNSGNKSAGTLRVTLATDQVQLTNALKVDGSATTQPVSIAGTVVVDDLAAAPTGSAVPANAQYQGNLAQTALPTAATPGNLVGNLSDKYGRQVVLPNAIRDVMGSQTTTITSSTSETTIITQAATIFNDLVSVFISNTSATAARVDIRDATAGSIIFQFFIPANDMRGVSLTTPWPQTTVNNNWTAQSSVSVSDLRISALFIKNK